NVTRTWFDIDLNGDQILEHIESKSVYDDAGRQIQAIDPAGRVTEFIYDSLDRVTQTIRRGYVAPGVTPGGTGDTNTADDATTQTIYDVLGRTIAEIDALG